MRVTVASVPPFKCNLIWLDCAKLTPLWGGILWSWFFRIRAGKLLASASDELVRRYNEYRKNPQTPGQGRAFNFIAWAPFIIGGIASAVILLSRA